MHPFNLWNITELAQHEGLMLVREEMFDQHLYPGYNIMRGVGSRCDETFYVGESSTFMFAFVKLDDKRKKKIKRALG
ncbi:hypothetical protein E2542_SST10192 [Spatholobus suberectus]|nr:hypothetical protein E2542_SST10192 [Spatholobus suberectus]